MTYLNVGLTANVAGLSYDLNDGSEILLLGYDLGIVPVGRLSQRSPAQRGDTDLGFSMEPRFSDLFWAIHGSSLSSYRDIRERFMTVFQPRDNDAVQLVFDFGDRVRALDVNVDGALNWADRVETIEKVSGVFKASDPRLYDPVLNTVVFSLASGGVDVGGWPIPWAIPWAIATDVLNVTADVLYAGGSRLAAIEYPVIRIFGPITDPVITNLTTGEIISLTDAGGLALATPADWVEIDLANPPRRDAKTIKDQDGNSAEEYLTTTSDFATWHLAPAGERLPAGNYADGHNIINVSGTGVTGVTLVTMRYYDRYLAV